VNSASALTPNKAISQYQRDEWSAEQGFPGGKVYAIAQTPDGYLWLGAEKGLVRFDGVRFQFFDPSISTEFPTGPIVGLVVDSEGTLWVRPRGLTLLRYRDGAFQDILKNVASPEADVTAMCLSRNGEILFSRPIRGITRYNKGGLASVAPASELPRLIISLAETGDGVVWMGTREEGLYYFSGGRVSALTQSLPDRKINTLLPLSEHELWIGTDAGVARWDGEAISLLGASRSLEHISAFAMIRDRDSNIWVGTSRGLERIHARGGFSVEQAPNTMGAVSALFEDREGNIWVGTERGIERLRDTIFTTYSAANGLPFESNGPVLVDLDGRTWFAPIRGGLYWLKEGQIGRVSEAGLGEDVVYSIDGRKGELWIGRRQKGITHLRYEGNAFKAETYTQAEGLAQNSVYVVHESRDGTIWAGTLTGGLSSFRGSNFKTYTAASGLTSNSISAIVESPDGTTWIGTPNGLAALSKGQWRTYTSANNLPTANVNCLLVDSSGTLWIGTAAGLAFLSSGAINSAIGLAEPLREPILGIEEDRTGSLWIATANRIVRVDRAKVLRQELTSADVREYGLADGLHSTQVVQRQRSVVSDSLGRIWFSTSRGISFVDPRSTTSGSAPALVHLDAISADGREIDLRRDLRIPAPHQRITLRYIALSLAVPERVRYVYKLEPFDKEWSDPASAREAVYTNLSPGSYRFRVLASNSDGLWNSPELSVPFTIIPVFWQAWWFRAACLALFILLVWMIYRLRVHSVEQCYLERKRAEEVLRRSEVYLTEAQSVTHTGSCAIDGTNRQILYWSAEMFRLFDFDPDQGLPLWDNWVQRIHPEDLGKFRVAGDRTFLEKEHCDVEFRIVKSDGTVRHIHAIGHPVLSPRGELVQVIGTMVDISERRRAEEAGDRLRQLEADLAHINRVSTMGELTASLAHEIKQPIGAAVTNAEACVRFLDRDKPDLLEAREAAFEMSRDARRAADIIEHVRSLYRKDSLHQQLVDVNEVIQEMVVILQNEANRHSVTMCTDLYKELPKVMADRVQFQQVLMNLMMNGIEAMRDASGELSIRSQLAEDGQLLISVSDKGVGLPTGKETEIFNAFFTTKSQGTGLGLAITRSIVESHGGHIWATANSGRGATFQFTLPQTKTAPA